ncbi:MAG: hypothetical protein RR547_04265 [Raoultibacter sp.]
MHKSFDSNATPEEIAELVDAVAGATWNTRNQIMEQRFKDTLERGDAHVPTFKPPGESLS